MNPWHLRSSLESRPHERFNQHATRESKRGMRGISGILSPRRHHVAASRMASMARRIGSDSVGHAATIFSSSGGRLGGRFAVGTSQVTPGKGITENVLESTKPKVTGSTPVGCNSLELTFSPTKALFSRFGSIFPATAGRSVVFSSLLDFPQLSPRAGKARGPSVPVGLAIQR